MRLHEIMTRQVMVLAPEASVIDAAQLMDSEDIGSVPICEGDRLVGIVTDRDLVVKVLAKGLDPTQVLVKDIMASPVIYAFEDQTAEEASEVMQASRVRRLAILNREKRLVGILALGDIATKVGPRISGEALEEISEEGRVA